MHFISYSCLLFASPSGESLEQKSGLPVANCEFWMPDFILVNSMNSVPHRMDSTPYNNLLTGLEDPSVPRHAWANLQWFREAH
jgi:hypothetical protein